LAASGDTLDQKWPKGTKRKAVMAAVRKLVDGASGEPAVLVRLQEYFKESAATGAEDDDGGDDGEEDDAAEADDAGGNEMVIEFLGADETASFVNPAWTKYLMLYLKTYGGLLKLRRENPSTGFFGNWGILAAAKRLADSHEVRGMGWQRWPGTAFIHTSLLRRCLTNLLPSTAGTSAATLYGKGGKGLSD
jgi:hypothetical protein